MVLISADLDIGLSEQGASSMESAFTIPQALLTTHEQSFELYNPRLGRYRLIPSFIQTLKTEYPNQRTTQETGIGIYRRFDEEHGETLDEIAYRLKYLGLNKNLISEGSNSSFILKLVKAMDFGRQTIEDKGRETGTPKNRLNTGVNTTLTPLNTEISTPDGGIISELHDERLLALVSQLTHTQIIDEYIQEYDISVPQPREFVTWVISQAIVRRFLPREPTITQRTIDMSTLLMVKSLGKVASSDPALIDAKPSLNWDGDRWWRRPFSRCFGPCRFPSLKSNLTLGGSRT